MDKAPDLGLPFFYRVVLPGFFLTLAGLPIIAPVLTAFGIMGKDQTPYLIGMGIGLGFVVSLLDPTIYELLEGRRGWPRWLTQLRTRRWTALVRQKYAQQETLHEDDPAYKECWYLLRQFPIGQDGNPTVTMPSRIGNVIAAYEQYPDVRYGMDSVFYWPRLWLVLEKDVREEIDNPWASVDAILYSGFGAGALAIVYLSLAGVTFAAWAIGYSLVSILIPMFWFIASLVLLAVFFICIRLAVPGLVRNGENFKSAFDLYRTRRSLRPASGAERQRWDRLSTRLQYGVESNEGLVHSVIRILHAIWR